MIWIDVQSMVAHQRTRLDVDCLLRWSTELLPAGDARLARLRALLPREPGT